jgi:hypothetical protein
VKVASGGLHQLTLQLRRFITTPDDSNREMLGELAKQYQQAMRSGSIECPCVPLRVSPPSK